MESKVAIVTGANKGLGYAIVKKLCEKNIGTVYLTSRDETRGKIAYEESNKSLKNCSFHQLDVTNENSTKIFIIYIKEKHGKIDVIINNAGILFLQDSPEPKLYQAEETVRVNFHALVNFTEAILPLLNDNGIIINISSSSGHLSRLPSEVLRETFKSDLTLERLKSLMESYVEAVKEGKDVDDGWGNSPYVVSKIGVNAYTFMLHRRLKSRGITVNSIHPGYVISDMTNGAGNVTPDSAALQVLEAMQGGGLYFWSNGTPVPWDGPDPRVYIDGKNV